MILLFQKTASAYGLLYPFANTESIDLFFSQPLSYFSFLPTLISNSTGYNRTFANENLLYVFILISLLGGLLK